MALDSIIGHRGSLWPSGGLPGENNTPSPGAVVEVAEIDAGEDVDVGVESVLARTDRKSVV